MDERVTIEEILEMLKRERFYRWYNGRFENYITNIDSPSEEEILKDLKRFLKK